MIWTLLLARFWKFNVYPAQKLGSLKVNAGKQLQIDLRVDKQQRQQCSSDGGGGGAGVNDGDDDADSGSNNMLLGISMKFWNHHQH